MAQASDSRVIRVFLSSTFRDFMAERDLLVKQVFPELRRKARERGVEVVEVDLRWGITEEESRQGKVLPICLAEIQRCRPYFVGMLGERYGWVPPADEDNRVVLADEEYAWVEEHLGRRSVTEMEILHGVLRKPEMAGRAFFYFRDPAWSQAQSEPGFVCDSTEEAEKLADLKQRIRDRRFPVEEDLPDPKALADRIGEDLWALIEEQFPELDQPDALEREERKHGSYRRSRTELYEDGGSGGGKVAQLEQWIATEEQRILITAESGSGKSALIANWMQRHQQSHPDDVVFAHHLGCSNDANALEPMLARMVQAASKLMADELSEPIKVPKDYWELVSTVTDTLSKLSYWCKQHGRRWIWVLDGLDRLPEENQQALPWLPLQLFPHLHVVISALDCAARTILQDREYTTLTIGPLVRDEQKTLIANYMRRFNKTLGPELEAKILEHEPARSPLFLRVVLDELRVCGRHETLAQQLDDYLKAQSVDALYAKVLERLEGDVGREAVEKVMTALWASRAGLSEPELLAITGVAPLQWAPIDLALQEAFERNHELLVFAHDYLRIAVADRYLPEEISQRNAHHRLANYFFNQPQYDTRAYTELPWQWLQSGDWENLWQLFSRPRFLIAIYNSCGLVDITEYWRRSKKHLIVIQGRYLGEHPARLSLADLIEPSIEEDIEDFKNQEDAEKLLIGYLSGIARLCEIIDVTGTLTMKARLLAFEISRDSRDNNEPRTLDLLGEGIESLIVNSDYTQARALCEYEISRLAAIYGFKSKPVLDALNRMFSISKHIGDKELVLQVCEKIRAVSEAIFKEGAIELLDVRYNHALAMMTAGNYDIAIAEIETLLEDSRFMGEDIDKQRSITQILAQAYGEIGDLDSAEKYARESLQIARKRYGSFHPNLIFPKSILACIFASKKHYELAKTLFYRCLEQSREHHGDQHIQTLTLLSQLGDLLYKTRDFDDAKTLLEEAASIEKVLFEDNSYDLMLSLSSCYNKLGIFDKTSKCWQAFFDSRKEKDLLSDDCVKGMRNLAFCKVCYDDDAESGATLYSECLSLCEKRYGKDSGVTINILSNFADTLSRLGRYHQTIQLRLRVLAWYREKHGDLDAATLDVMSSLAADVGDSGDPLSSVQFYSECLAGRVKTLGSEHPSTMACRYNLAGSLSDLERYEEAIELRRIVLAWCIETNGDADPNTYTSITSLASDLRESGELEEAEALFRELVAARQKMLEPDDFQIGQALGGLAKTLEEAGKLEEALIYSQEALDHRQTHEGPDAWWTNRARLELAHVLQKLERNAEAAALLQELQESMDRNDAPGDADRQLIADAAALRRAIETGESL